MYVQRSRLLTWMGTLSFSLPYLFFRRQPCAERLKWKTNPNERILLTNNTGGDDKVRTYDRHDEDLFATKKVSVVDERSKMVGEFYKGIPYDGRTKNEVTGDPV